eukprot:jgi/Mesvir1/22792/Mv14179-RA.2
MKRNAPMDELEENEGDQDHTSTSDDFDDSDNEKDARKVPSRKKESIFRPPSAEEIEEMKSASSLSVSSLFRLELSELLTQHTFNYDKADAVEAALASFRAAVHSMPQKQVPLSLVSGLIASLGMGAAATTEEAKYGLRFAAPDTIEVLGSYAQHTLMRPRVNVNLVLHMPASCLREKDYLDHRYHVKRALYLAAIARFLNKKQVFGPQGVAMATSRADWRKPVLVIHLGRNTSKPKVAKQLPIVLVSVAIPHDAFPASKLSPTRGNLSTALAADGTTRAPTPVYNASIMEDMRMAAHHHYLTSKMRHVPQLREAICLIKVWLHQRRLDDAPQAFNPFLVAMFMGHLADVGTLTQYMSGYQMFHVTLSTLANSDMLHKGVVMRAGGGSQASVAVFDKKSLAAAYPVVFADPLGYNMAAHVSKAALEQLRRQAGISAALLATAAGTQADAFDALFLSHATPAADFDVHVRVTLPAPDSATLLASDTDGVRSACLRVEQLLARALSDRARLVVANSRVAEGELDLTKPLRVGSPATHTVSVGIFLAASEAAFRLVDVGPAADHKEEAKRFRDFWGPRAELRRFKDGTIAEAAVWECPPASRHLIVENICKHVLSRHLKISADAVQTSLGVLDLVLDLDAEDPELRVQAIHQQFLHLSKMLRALKGLPLAIVSLQPTGAVFRHTAVSVPHAHPLASSDAASFSRTSEGEPPPLCVDTLEVLMQLEGSGKWPDKPEPVRKMKAAFYVQISKSLMSSFNVPSVVAEDSLDILFGGFAYRVLLYYEREEALKGKAAAAGVAAGVAAAGGAAAAVATSQHLESSLRIRALHASTLSGLQGLHPVFGSAARLAKRWAASHLFSNWLSEEVVELLVARLFVHPQPFAPPVSRVTALYRFFVLLSTYDWEGAPLLVDVNQELTEADRKAIQLTFESLRKSPHNSGAPRACALFVATAADRESSLTRHRPSAEVLARLVAYAGTCADVMKELLSSGDQGRSSGSKWARDERWKSLFHTPLDAFDAVILLRHRALPRASMALFPVLQGDGDTLTTTDGTADGKHQVLSLQRVPLKTMAKGGAAAQQALLVGFDPVATFARRLEASRVAACTFGALGALIDGNRGFVPSGG